MSKMAPRPRPSGGDVNISYKLETGTTVTFIAAAIVVGLRFIARKIYGRLGWDDYAMMFATVQALVATILDFVAIRWGLGRHLFFLDPQQQVKQQYFSLLAQVFCIHALTFAKISICLQYTRVIRGSQKTWLRWACDTLAILVFFVNGMVTIVFYAHCIPAEKTWNPSIQGTCWDPASYGDFLILQGAFSAATDYILCILPIFLFKDLQVGMKSKVMLCTLMGLGLITGIFATIRTAETVAGLKSPLQDPPYDSIMGLTWAGMERNIAIMLGSIPALRPLVTPLTNLTSRTFSGSFFSSKKSQTESYDIGSKGSKMSLQDHYDLEQDGMGGRKTSWGQNGTKYSQNSTTTKSHTSQERILPIQNHEDKYRHVV